MADLQVKTFFQTIDTCKQLPGYEAALKLPTPVTTSRAERALSQANPESDEARENWKRLQLIQGCASEANAASIGKNLQFNLSGNATAKLRELPPGRVGSGELAFGTGKLELTNLGDGFIVDYNQPEKLSAQLVFDRQGHLADIGTIHGKVDPADRELLRTARQIVNTINTSFYNIKQPSITPSPISQEQPKS